MLDEKGILSKYDNVRYELDSRYINLLKMCDGTNLISDICEKMQQHSADSLRDVQSDILMMIEKLCEANIVTLVDNPSDKYYFWGEIGLYYPLYISVELTSRCNFACQFCYKNAYYKGTDIEPMIMKELFEMIGGKTRDIQFTGGEPFLNKNIDDYIRLFCDHNISIVTNGSMLFQHDDSILRMVSLYQISMYGCNMDEYAANTHYALGWNNLKSSIAKLNSLGCNYHLSVVINKNNYFNLEDYIRAAIDLGAHKIIFGTQTPVGRGMKNKSCLSIDEYRIAFRLLKCMIKKYSPLIEIEEWSHKGYENDTTLEVHPVKEYQGLLPCGSGTSHFVISQEGKVRPCELLPEKYFNLGGIEVIKRAIRGNFTNKSILKGATDFNEELNQYGQSCAQFCGPLEKLLNSSNADK